MKTRIKELIVEFSQLRPQINILPDPYSHKFDESSKQIIQDLLIDWRDCSRRNEITIEECCKLVGLVQSLWPLQIDFYFGGRLDRKNPRTLSQFQADLISNATVEKHWSQWWLDRYASTHWPNYGKHRNVGVDLDGTLYLDSETMDQPDLQIFPDRFFVEWKCVPCDYKETFKKCNLESYDKYDAWMICLHFAAGYRDVESASPVSYVIFKPDGITRMLRECNFAKMRELKNKMGTQLAVEPSLELWNGATHYSDFGKKVMINGRNSQNRD